MDHFKLVAPYQPTGDQPQAIAKLTDGVLKGYREQTMLGVPAAERPSQWRILSKI